MNSYTDLQAERINVQVALHDEKQERFLLQLHYPTKPVVIFTSEFLPKFSVSEIGIL